MLALHGQNANLAGPLFENYRAGEGNFRQFPVGPDRGLGGNDRRCKSALGDPSGATDRSSRLWKRGRGLCNCWLGPATRGDMVWWTTALYGHFGLDLKGKNGGLVRIDDLVIEDVI